MSLKAFHFVFIVFSIFLAIGCAFWGINEYLQFNQTADLIFAIVGMVGTLALLGYFKAVLRKYKDLSYL